MRQRPVISIRPEDVDALVILLFSAYYCLPIVFTKTPFFMMLIGCLIYGLITAINKKKILFAMVGNELIILLIVILLKYLGDVATTPEFISKIWSLTTCFFPVYLLYRYNRIECKRIQKRILIGIGVMYAVTLFLTSNELVVNPKAMRTYSLQTSLYERNIGHFDFAYANVIILFLVWIIYKYLNKTKSQWRHICLGGVGFLVVFQIRTQYTLALMTAIIILFYLYLLNKQRKSGAITMYLIVLVAILFLVPTALKLMIRIIPFEGVTTRLNELFSFIYSGEELGYNSGGRMELYALSFNAFISGFFTGNVHLNFNSHSSFLSIMAHTGIWGAICLFFIMNRVKKQINKLLISNNVEIYIYKPVYLAILLTGFTNPLFSSFLINFAGYFIVPAVLIYLSKIEKS